MSEKVGKIEIVIKGGKPWGFRLQAKAENRSVVIVEEIVRGGRADQQGKLKVGDHVIKINGIQCLSLADALQLIDSAFRTLTIVVWRTNNFLSEDKPKDYFDSVHQFEQLPISPPCHSPNNPQTSSIYENINFSFQEGKQRSRKFSPIENVYHSSSKDNLSISFQQLPSNNAKMYSGRNDYNRNTFKSLNSSLGIPSKNEPEKKAKNVNNPERKQHSKTQRDLHQYSNVQPLPALNYMPEINKYDGRHFSRTSKEIRPYSNVHSVNNSTYGKVFKISNSPEPTAVSSIPLQANNMPTTNHNSNVHSINNSTYGKVFKVSDSPEPPSVPSIPVQANNMLTTNHSSGQFPVSNRLTSAKVSSESDCCRYPNCHNKYFNCKIHSPPERDVTYPVSESFSNDYENIDIISQSSFMYKDQNNCDSLIYEQNVEAPPLNSVPFGNKKKVLNNRALKWEKDYVPSNHCDYPVISSSTKPSNYKLESLNYTVPKSTSDAHTISSDENSMSSLCHFSNSVYEEKLDSPVISSSIKPSNYKLESLNYIVPKTTSDICTPSMVENSVSSSCHFSSGVYEEKLNSPNISSSTKLSNYNIKSLNYIVPKTTSDTRVPSMGENSVSSLCHFSDSVYDEKLNSQAKVSVTTSQSVKDSNVFHYKSVYGQIKHLSYNMQGKESTSECLYSSNSKPSFKKGMFSSMNNASFIKENDMFFGANNNSMCMISKEAAVVKLVSSRPQKIYIDEDDELKEIDENRNRTALGFSSISASPPPPTPPPENDTEIMPCNEPLPAPPLFVSEQKQNNGNEMVETIYANLEMLKIQYSVVSSSQTSSSNEQHSMTFSNSMESIADNISSSTNICHPNPSELVEANPQGDATFMEKTFQNQEGKNLRLFNLPFNSAYFTTSVPKAKLLTRYTSKLQSDKMPEVNELSNEKEELIASLRKKLDILLEEEAAVQDELQQNEELGHNLSAKLESTATQNEWKKFNNHVQELEKITNLLLSLSGRSARTKNALLILPSNAPVEEKMLLETKYKKLTQQYEEALQLQKNIDNRNKQVLFYLQKYFTKDELADYNHFINMKVKLLVDYKELVEKIKLGEEQLKALTNS